MNPIVKFTLGRVGIFAGLSALFLLIPLPLPTAQGVLVKLMVAAVVSLPLSYVALRTWREQAAEYIAERMRRRAAEKERLRSELEDG